MVLFLLKNNHNSTYVPSINEKKGRKQKSYVVLCKESNLQIKRDIDRISDLHELTLEIKKTE